MTATARREKAVLLLTRPGDDCDGFWYHLATLDVNITPGTPFPTRTKAIQHAMRVAHRFGVEIARTEEDDSSR